MEDDGINIGFTICSHCGDFILKHFKTCPSCNTEVGSSVIKSGIPSPEPVSMDPSMFVCLNCGAFIGVDATHCKACGTKRAPLTAEIDISSGKESKADIYLETTSGLSLCTNCGSLLSQDAQTCTGCGLEVQGDDSEDIEEGDGPTETDSVNVHDVLETKKENLFLCSNCGAFLSPNATNCGICGESIKNLKDPFLKKKSVADSEEDKLSSSGIIFVCEECGAFLGPHTKVCGICGTGVSKGVEPKAEPELLKEIQLEDASGKAASKILDNKVSRPKKSARKIAHIEPKKTKADVIRDLKRLWYKKAIALKKLGKYKEALSSLNKALSQDHDDKDLILAKADIYYELRRYKQAARLYKRLIESEPKSVVLWNRLGNTLLRMGNPEESLIFYDKALSIESNNVEAMVNKGYILMKQKKYDEAIKYAEKIEV